jgi:hypothetical protein
VFRLDSRALPMKPGKPTARCCDVLFQWMVAAKSLEVGVRHAEHAANDVVRWEFLSVDEVGPDKDANGVDVYKYKYKY